MAEKILATLVIIMLVVCLYFSSTSDSQPEIMVIQGCEYFQQIINNKNIYSHKGNCKNPIHKCECKFK